MQHKIQLEITFYHNRLHDLFVFRFSLALELAKHGSTLLVRTVDEDDLLESEFIQQIGPHFSLSCVRWHSSHECSVHVLYQYK